MSDYPKYTKYSKSQQKKKPGMYERFLTFSQNTTFSLQCHYWRRFGGEHMHQHRQSQSSGRAAGARGYRSHGTVPEYCGRGVHTGWLWNANQQRAATGGIG